MGHFIERCLRCGQHKSEGFWYNSRVSHKRDSLFDIVPNIGKSVRPSFQCLEYRPEALVGRPDPWPLQPTATGKTLETVGRFRRNRHHSEELRKRIQRPQHVRKSVLGFVAKPLTLHNEEPNTTVRRVVSTRRALYSCFSLRLLAAPATRRDFEGAPLFFSVQGGGTRYNRRGRRMNDGHQMPALRNGV